MIMVSCLSKPLRLFSPLIDLPISELLHLLIGEWLVIRIPGLSEFAVDQSMVSLASRTSLIILNTPSVSCLTSTLTGVDGSQTDLSVKVTPFI